jgi:hypothetical protein
MILFWTLPRWVNFFGPNPRTLGTCTETERDRTYSYSLELPVPEQPMRAEQGW